MKWDIGWDEAGRGPVLGNMFVAAVAIPHGINAKAMFPYMNDSKKLTPTQRLSTARLIRENPLVRYIVMSCTPQEIDSTNINYLLFLRYLALCEGLIDVNFKKPTDEFYIYGDDPWGGSHTMHDDFRRKLTLKYSGRIREITVIPKGDATFPSVMLASILAKDGREKHMEEVRAKVGDCGTGYPSDWKSVEFVKRCIKTGTNLEYIRKKWGTYRRYTEIIWRTGNNKGKTHR